MGNNFPIMPDRDVLLDELTRADSSNDSGDIAAMMANLELSVRLGTDYQAPVETPAARTVAKTEGEILAKRASLFTSTKKAHRVEKLPASPDGFWVRHFDENDNLFRVFWSESGEDTGAGPELCL